MWSVFLIKQGPLSKCDVDDCELLPSYNTIIRKYSLRLFEINAKFVERHYNMSPKKCACCGTDIPFEQRINKFCSHSCSATFNNTGRIRKRKEEDFSLSGARAKRYLVVKGVGEKSVVSSTCLCCGIEMAQSESGNRKYCSTECASEYRFTESFLEWYNGKSSPKNAVLRRYLTVWKGYSCTVCGVSEWNGSPITLEVEHINGNSDDNSKENVCLICPNCHSQTSTYKARNKGNGRVSRRLRYQQGKSY